MLLRMFGGSHEVDMITIEYQISSPPSFSIKLLSNSRRVKSGWMRIDLEPMRALNLGAFLLSAIFLFFIS